MSFALDFPNRKLYVARNGIWTNGSNNDWGSSTFDSTVGALDVSGKILTDDSIEIVSTFIDNNFPLSSASSKLPWEEILDGILIPCTLAGPNASTAMAAVTAESIPPDNPITTPSN